MHLRHQFDIDAFTNLGVHVPWPLTQQGDNNVPSIFYGGEVKKLIEN